MTDRPDREDGVGGSGYSLEELSAYADRGRRPPIVAIDRNPQCQAVLDGIERLGTLGRDAIDAHAAASAAPDETWIEGILESIAREARAGDDVPFATMPDGTRVAMTEGAIREVARNAGDGVPGVLVGRVRVAIAPGRRARVEIVVSVVYDRPLASAADEVRAAVDELLRRQTPVIPDAIDVVVGDVHLSTARRERP